MNVEDYERGMDAQWRHSDIVATTCLYDSVQDARSESRYEGTESEDSADFAWYPVGGPETTGEGIEAC